MNAWRYRRLGPHADEFNYSPPIRNFTYFICKSFMQKNKNTKQYKTDHTMLQYAIPRGLKDEHVAFCDYLIHLCDCVLYTTKSALLVLGPLLVSEEREENEAVVAGE